MLKRSFDAVVSLSALIVLGPLLLLIGIWVKLDSSGPILFRQKRVGYRGKNFQILKFRSMRDLADTNGPQITVESDNRITRAGHFLRKYKLDELPQLYCVLVGHMSLVGPRPEVPKFVKLYSAQVRKTVLSVRPGITDLASIEYRDESSLLADCDDPERTYVDEIMPAKLEYCVAYANDHNFLMDLRIILRTIFKIVT